MNDIMLITTLLFASVLYASQRSLYFDFRRRESMPEELKRANLEMSEEEIILKKRGLFAKRRVDQVFIGKKGNWIIVDSKTRRRHEVKWNDVLQISEYRAILAETNKGIELSSHGYIRTVTNPEEKDRRKLNVKYHKVELISVSDALKLIEKNS